MNFYNLQQNIFPQEKGCPENLNKNCGKIDSKNNVLCLKNDKPCPVNSFIFLSKNDFVRSELLFEKAVSLSPQSIDFIDKLAQAKIMLNKLDEAISLLNNNLKTNNKQEGSYVNLGFAYLKQNNIALAKNNYNKALALNPDNEQALLNLAAVYNIENNKTEALKLLKRILVINPKNEEVKQLMGKLEY